jgi:hypothetical protein
MNHKSVSDTLNLVTFNFPIDRFRNNQSKVLQNRPEIVDRLLAGACILVAKIGVNDLTTVSGYGAEDVVQGAVIANSDCDAFVLGILSIEDVLRHGISFYSGTAGFGTREEGPH